jgi:hypothetical protein
VWSPTTGGKNPHLSRHISPQSQKLATHDLQLVAYPSLTWPQLSGGAAPLFAHFTHHQSISCAPLILHRSESGNASCDASRRGNASGFLFPHTWANLASSSAPNWVESSEVIPLSMATLGGQWAESDTLYPASSVRKSLRSTYYDKSATKTSGSILTCMDTIALLEGPWPWRKSAPNPPEPHNS